MNGYEYFLSRRLKNNPVGAFSALLVCASLVLSPLALHAESHHDQASGSMKLSSAPSSASGSPSVQVDFKVEQIDGDDAAAETKAKLSEFLGGSGSDILVVSSDEDSVLSQVVTEAQLNSQSQAKKRGQVFLIPFGKAVKTSAHVAGGVNEALRFSGAYLVNAFKKDKIGVSIATFTLGNEIVRWMHVTTASNFVVTSNIIYSVLWASLFLDKDTWSKVTKPIQKTYRRVFDLAEITPNQKTTIDIGIKFLSGLTLSLVLNGGRVAIVGIDQLSKAAFAPLALTMPFVMGAVMTAAGFSWSELIGSVDEGQYPKAKKRLRFIMNSRSCLISYFAASAMLMNPESYGLSPWIAVTLSGATGLFLYTNASRFVPLLEKVGLRARSRGMCQAVFN